MTEQITLSDVCKIPDLQIHSKTAMFKFLVSRQSAQMLKLRENIVKLSYTNKIIGVKGDQVGILSKRLPLKYKQHNQPQKSSEINEYYKQNTGFLSHKKFYVQPLATVKKIIEPQEQKLQMQSKTTEKFNNNSIFIRFQEKKSKKFKEIQLATKNICEPNTEYKSTKGFRSRTQSMARLSIYQRKSTKNKFNLVEKQKTEAKTERTKIKSFSNLLSGIQQRKEFDALNIPLLHQQNTLFKRYQLLESKQNLNRFHQSQQNTDNNY